MYKVVTGSDLGFPSNGLIYCHLLPGHKDQYLKLMTQIINFCKVDNTNLIYVRNVKENN